MGTCRDEVILLGWNILRIGRRWAGGGSGLRLHVFVAVLDGDLGEGNAGRGGVAGREHAGEVQCGVAVLEVELVHGGGELIAIAGLFEE